MEKIRLLQYLEPGYIHFTESEKKQPGENQIGIKILASSLCNSSELRSYTGNQQTGYGVVYPMAKGEPGHEAVGIIAETGKSVKGLNKGDYVVMTGLGGDPCHSSYVLREYKDVAKVNPGERDIKEAAILEMYGCAYHCVMSPLSEEDYSNKKAALIGMGAIGLCTLQILRTLKNVEITVIDILKDRLDTAVNMGADKAWTPAMLEQSNKYDIVIECSGSTKGQELAFELAPRVLIFSSYNTKKISIKQSLLFDANTTIYNPGILTSEDLKIVADLYNRKLIKPGLLISKKIRPEIEEYLQTINEIKEGKIIKALIEWEK